ncbi:MAG: TauD/TfdA family dioxygenase [Acidobacteriota bacterium]|nr:TauD/TfdA family dioxygenase [Acidobacteriota bacterium]
MTTQINNTPGRTGRKRPSFKPGGPRKSSRRMAMVDTADLVTESFIDPHRLPLVLTPNSPDVDLAEWAGVNRDRLERLLLTHGAILLRGFGITSIVQFERVCALACGELFGKYGDLPPEEQGEKIYKSTPYPEDKPILFHNESCHMARWPSRQFFYCVKASKEGGETPLVDCRQLYRALPEALARDFSTKGLLYVRNFKEGLDVSWRDFFKTEDRDRVEKLCRRDGIQFQWLPGDGLRIRQYGPGVITHPKTGEKSFFNQIQLHHIGYLDEEMRELMPKLYAEEEYPRHVYFGDGSPIPDDAIEIVNQLYWDHAVALPWQEGDIIMLDNMLVAHARKPYVGPRKICVAMGDMVESDQVEWQHA